MGIRSVSWESYWLDDAWLRPGKAHAFVRQTYGGTGSKALCGYQPAYDCNPMYHDGEPCKRCQASLEKRDDLVEGLF